MKIDLYSWGEIELINFIDMSETEKQMVLEWRNNNTIRKWMFNQEPISLQDHLLFIETLKTIEDKQYFLLKKGGEYIGVVDFIDIDSLHYSAECGLYANPLKKIDHAGKMLIEVAIRYAFKQLRMKRLLLEIFATNAKAIHLYTQYAFQKSGTKIFNGKEVICMELNSENR